MSSINGLQEIRPLTNSLTKLRSRTPDPVLYLTPECKGMLDPFEWCFADGMGRKPFPLHPKCWNFNESIETHKPCRSPQDGSLLPFCFEVSYEKYTNSRACYSLSSLLQLAITQNAYISECGGRFKDTDSCGTFLEVHRPNKREILTQVRLKGQYTSGYSGVVISSTYRNDENRIICQGDYEVIATNNSSRL